MDNAGSGKSISAPVSARQNREKNARNSTVMDCFMCLFAIIRYSPMLTTYAQVFGLQLLNIVQRQIIADCNLTQK